MFSISAVQTNNRQELSDGYSMDILVGDTIEQILPFTQQMCLTYYREYPYLYEGTLEEQQACHSWFSKLKHSAVAIAYYDNKPVGFLSGASFVDFAEHYTGSLTVFKNAGLDPAQYYYFADVIIEKEHRGHSLCKKLFAALEQYASNLGYAKNCLVVESHATHPCKPADYRELGDLWIRLGYTESPATISFKWNTIQSDGTQERQEHILRYWIKDFKA